MTRLTLSLLLALLLAACTGEPGTEPSPGNNGNGHEQGDGGGPAVTNRIDVPPAVRQNLGITFATVERRLVQQTERAPGRFELRPSAYREYRAWLAGHVELAVGQYQRIAVGDVVYRLVVPGWGRVQKEIGEAQSAVRTAEAELGATVPRLSETRREALLLAERGEAIPAWIEAVGNHRTGLLREIEIWQARVDELVELIESGAGLSSQLAEARGALAGARTRLAETEEEEADLEFRRLELSAESRLMEAQLPRIEAEVARARTAVEEAHTHLSLTLDAAAAMLGLTREELEAPGPDGRPHWQTTRGVTVRADRAGTVELIARTNGAWAEPGELVVRTQDPTALRFRASGLQAQLAMLRDGAEARIVLPAGGPLAGLEPLPATVRIGLEAHPDDRTIDLIATPVATDGELPAWARNGVAAQLEYVVGGSGRPSLAIPDRAVIQDGLEMIFFRRDPADANKVIRCEADLGVSDGRWIEVLSGVRQGDQVVLDGVYELKLTGGGKAPEGGHFHADGTWHAGNHH